MATVEDPETAFPEAHKILKQFIISDEDLVKIMNGMSKEVKAGLNADTNARASIPCHLSYVQDLPTGRERGRFLALEMWPTNCRIMLVKFGNEKDVYMSSKAVVIPYTVAAGRGDELFNFLAENIAIFVRDKKVEKENLPMGIAFTFSMKKLALDVGILVAWSRGFGAENAVGKNVVDLLRVAVAKHKDIAVNIVGIVNDAVGSLMALAWSYPDCKIGLIVGTFTNAAYVEETDNCQMFEGDVTKPYMIINSDMARYGENAHLDFIRNEFDKALDLETNNPGYRLFEKCVSTLYIGELVRSVIVRLMRQGVIFKEHNLEYIGIRWKMEMKSLIAIESDPPGVHTKCQEVMDKFRMRNCLEKDLACVRYICEVITARSAKLVACGLACFIHKMDYAEISVAVDGGVYRLHPTYSITLNKEALKLVNPSNRFKIIVAEDSAGVGAAIVAGLAVMAKNRSTSKARETMQVS
ncbi:hexokinase type 1 [Scaptodrosophila lebanonensis]|uniref:Phosphotransferase n=1 Tax=Drosophila lebanonensis TaxID=7225 RepID=A0A6J2TIS4_DROLE|nr:hexokinase type 1 [Scaptodrosophila lebanonensis]